MARPLLKKVVGQFQQFAAIESFGGVILVACTLVALAWANSPWSESYHHLWHTPVSVSIGPYMLDQSLAHWINEVCGRRGPLWQDETYDHIIRNQADYQETAAYILDNAPRKGLVKQATDWPWWGKGGGM